jgi:hypothetical protein
MNRALFSLLIFFLGVSPLTLDAEESAEEVQAIALAKISKWLDIPRDRFDRSADLQEAIFSRFPKGTSEAETHRKIKSVLANPPSDLKVRVTYGSGEISVGIAYFSKEKRWFELVVKFNFSDTDGTLVSVKTGGVYGNK